MKTIGKYELLATIGNGGMANVYLARHRGPMGFEKIVVVKTILPHLAHDKRFIEMFLDEARLAAQINHHNVVQVYDLGEEQNTYFMVMEYLAGESLTNVLEQSLQQNCMLPIHVSTRIIAAAAEGLHAAHELKNMGGQMLDVVHRDVSLGNVIVLYDGGVKVVDFGIAKAKDRLFHTVASEIKGKFSYMSPEQIEGKTLDRRADIYSLGIVLWETLTLRRLFNAPNYAAAMQAILSGKIEPPSMYRPEIPNEVNAIVLRALALKPEDRFQTALEMQHALLRSLPTGPSGIADSLNILFAERIKAREELLKKIIHATGSLPEDDLKQTLDHFSRDNSHSASLLHRESQGIPDLEVQSDDVLLERHEKSQRHLLRFKYFKPFILGGFGAVVFGMLGMELWNERQLLYSRYLTRSDKHTSANATPVALPKVSNKVDTPEKITNSLEPIYKNTTPPANQPTLETTADDKEKTKAKIKSKNAPQKSSRDIADEDIQQAQSHYHEAVRLVIEGKLLEAEKNFLASINFSKSYAPTYRGLGLLYEEKHQYRLAIRHLRSYLSYAADAQDADFIKNRIQELESKIAE